MKKIGYARQWIDGRDIKAVCRVLKSDYLTQGPKVEDFERAVSSYCGAKYAVAVNSGTSALHIACLAAGLAPKDEAITSPITFVASSNCILYCRATPAFADINEDTVCIDPDQIIKKISSRTKIIIPVDFGGQPCRMDKIYEIAHARNIVVIEDACHAMGSEFMGSRTGSCKYSDMTVFSFHAVKQITTGEGGMVLTNNKEFYRKLVLLRTHGITRNPQILSRNPGPWYYEMRYLGFNYRLTDFQSALGLSQLKRLPGFIRARKKIVDIYNREFSRCEEIKLIQQQPEAFSSHHLYIIRLDLTKVRIPKKVLFTEYMKKGIIVNLHYIPAYYHPYYKSLGFKKGLCPLAEKYYEEAITLPLYPSMSKTTVDKVIKATLQIINKYKVKSKISQ